ncbi:hypothetical protein Slin14017_G082890 [Septoria linicola]|nr:hypothetical protein Slin14017_G082890 [Septoria linicola]
MGTRGDKTIKEADIAKMNADSVLRSRAKQLMEMDSDGFQCIAAQIKDNMAEYPSIGELEADELIAVKINRRT